MSHTHHNCSCNHETVKFCKTCQIVHCVDCNQEWSKRVQTYWYNTNTTPYLTYTGTTVPTSNTLTGGGGTYGDTTGCYTAVQQAVVNLNDTDCKHSV